MRFFRFDRAAASPLSAAPSKNTMLNRVAALDGQAQIEVFHMGPRADITFEQTKTPQLFMVVQGAGYVQAGPARRAISAGQAVYWDEGESHWIGSDYGLLAVVVESAALDPENVLAPLA